MMDTVQKHTNHILLLGILCLISLVMLPRDFFLIELLHPLYAMNDLSGFICHSSLFAVITFIAYIVASQYLDKRHALIYIVCALALIGFGTEIYQSFIPSRTANWLDVLANHTGIIFSATLIELLLISRARLALQKVHAS